MRPADPHRALIRALARHFPGLLVLASRTEPWASITFTGTRHILTCADGIDLARIEDAELPLPGHFAADVRVSRDGERLTIEALTIEDV
ncbi:MAG TPA: hypothetical protein VE567_02715 [Sphingomonas sp.]|nr:hypothetical protein [Sphingomonas sp.]